jgi:hypothetical protein
MVLKFANGVPKSAFCMTRKMQIREKDNGLAEPSSEHLPVSERFEGVAEVLDLRASAIVGPNDRHDVEAAAHFKHVVFAHELKGDVREPSLFLRSDRLGRNAVPSRFHFDEHQRVAIARDQVNLTTLGSIAVQQDAHAVAFQMPRGGSFSAFAEQPIQESSYNRWSQYTPRSFSIDWASGLNELQADLERVGAKNGFLSLSSESTLVTSESAALGLPGSSLLLSSSLSLGRTIEWSVSQPVEPTTTAPRISPRRIN